VQSRRHWAVVGSFVDDAILHFAPWEGATSQYVMAAGKTAWVLGVDETGAFYQVIWGCEHHWVLVETMGPNYDEVWQGHALPTEIVE